MNADAQQAMSSNKNPLRLTGILDQFKSFDLTPIIGREFQDVDLAEWLRAPNSDDLIRDLAITVSQRGVVFFRAQNSMNNDLQKELAQRLGELTGKPSSSKLHIHPLFNSAHELGGSDDEISFINSVEMKRFNGGSFLDPREIKQSGKEGWHSDITYEPVPSDYAILRLIELPEVGGDTLWASGYELYDRISTPYQKFLESLTATYAQPLYASTATDFSLYTGIRGSSFNAGSSLTAIHPVIRTNPVTGWKSVFAIGHHVQKINDVTPLESQALIDWFLRLVMENHDLQVRHRWVNKNDLAIWDNRSVYHTGTPDHEGFGERVGHRAVSLGEKPFLDPSSRSRRAALRDEEALRNAKAEQGTESHLL